MRITRGGGMGGRLTSVSPGPDLEYGIDVSSIVLLRTRWRPPGELGTPTLGLVGPQVLDQRASPG
jgi:hypothetical protein